MSARAPERHELDPIEIASRDEIAALQLARLQATLRRAYDHVAHYRAAFDQAGVHPDDLRTLADLARFPFTTKEDLRRHYPFGMFAVPRARGRAHPRLVGHDRQADGGRLHQGRHRDLGRGLRALDPGRRRPPGRSRPRGLRLRPVHRRPRRALRRRAARLHGGADVGRHDRAPGPADRRLRARHHHGDALLHAGDRRRVRPPGPRSARLLAPDRDLRRRALDRGDARRDRGSASRSTRSTSTASPR